VVFFAQNAKHVDIANSLGMLLRLSLVWVLQGCVDESLF
jgi:hypothetical protein